MGILSRPIPYISDREALNLIDVIHRSTTRVETAINLSCRRSQAMAMNGAVPTGAGTGAGPLSGRSPLGTGTTRVEQEQRYQAHDSTSRGHGQESYTNSVDSQRDAPTLRFIRDRIKRLLTRRSPLLSADDMPELQTGHLAGAPLLGREGVLKPRSGR